MDKEELQLELDIILNSEPDEVWTEKTKEYGKVLFDYFFLTEEAGGEFVGIDHVYPKEFEDIGEGSDHIPVVVELENKI